jgi:hypothetical protein
MKVYIPALESEHSRRGAAVFQRLAAYSSSHELVDRVHDADLALITQAHMYPKDWRLKELRRFAKALGGTCATYIYDERDRPWCSLPGLYVSMPARSFNSSQVAVPYAWLEEGDFTELRTVPVRNLLTFMGTRSHRVRSRIFDLGDSLGPVLETPYFPIHDCWRTSGNETRRAQYLINMASAGFVLCPRGHGTSSIRMYEAMAAGRVPVIISDEWVPPQGVDWQACSVRWPESQVSSLPSFLAAMAPSLGTMMERSAWEFDRHFSTPRRFDYFLAELRRTMAHEGKGFRPILDAEYLRYSYVGFRDSIKRRGRSASIGSGRLGRSKMCQNG